MKVNILGTEYDITFNNTQNDSYLRDSDGYTDWSSKKIVICEKESDCEIEDFESYQKKVMRHEIIHAFMEESGLSVNFEHKSIGIEETMIYWIAIQFPKISLAFTETGCL